MTRGGEDTLLPTEENTADFILAPTEEEVASAITKSIRNVMAVVCNVMILYEAETNIWLRLELFKNLSA